MSRISWELIVFSILVLGNLPSCAINPEQADPALPIAEPTPA
jgi:hypothetical protein